MTSVMEGLLLNLRTNLLEVNLTQAEVGSNKGDASSTTCLSTGTYAMTRSLNNVLISKAIQDSPARSEEVLGCSVISKCRLCDNLLEVLDLEEQLAVD